MGASAITANAPGADDLRWVTAAALAAMAARGLRQGSVFTSADLDAWVPQLKLQRKRATATTRLCALGVVTCERRVDVASGQTIGEYTVTKQGAEAIRATVAGHVHKSGPKGPHAQRKAVQPHTFVARLWALMRARKLLDAETAAATLVDAGGDVSQAAKTARRYFHRWVDAGALAESAQRVNAHGTSNGFKRYVLVNDCGPVPPHCPPKKKVA
ncbi:MAG: hypothetical protein KF796_19540 [Ramlibacter sp.]|nr:hypothetical protein [Ramlibacter sp.]